MALFFVFCVSFAATPLVGRADPPSALDRPIDVVTIRGSDLPGFLPVNIDRVHLFAWNGVAFEPIPFQVDEVVPEADLLVGLDYCGDPDPEWRTPNQIEVPDSLCEENYAFDFAIAGTPGAGDTGGPGVLDADDEIVFRARDAATVCAPANTWLPDDLTATTSTLRYDIVLNDNRYGGASLQNVGTGCVSAFLYDAPQPRRYDLDDSYVQWQALNPSAQGPDCRWRGGANGGEQVRGPKACGRAVPGPRAAGHPTLDLRWIGNWTMDELRLDGNDILDRLKTRMNIAVVHNEEGYDKYCCAIFMGIKSFDETTRKAPIRVLRYAKGSLSGYGTSRNDWYYGTHLVFRVRLRVHSGPGKLRTYLDFDQDGTLGEFYTEKHPPGQNPDAPADDNSVAGNDSEAEVLTHDDYRPEELNWSLLDMGTTRLLFMIEETDPFEFTGATSHYYSDRSSRDDSPESTYGTLGAHGTYWDGGAKNMQDTSCEQSNDPEEHLWREAYWHVIPMAAGRSVDEYVGWLRNELTVSTVATEYVPPPADPPPRGGRPCPPSLVPSIDSNGEFVDLSPAVIPQDPECDNASYTLYRAVGVGAFRQLAATKPGASHLDRQVAVGMTYRYRAFAHNTDGSESEASPIVQVTVNDVEPPTPPTVVVADPLPNAARLSWVRSTSSDVVGVDVFVSDTPGGPYQKVNSQVVPSGTTEFVIASLDPATTYYLVLEAVDHVGLRSAATPEVSVMPDM